MHLISAAVLVAVLSCFVNAVDCDEHKRNDESEVKDGEDKHNRTSISQGKDTTGDKISNSVVIAIIGVGGLLTIALMGMLVAGATRGL